MSENSARSASGIRQRILVPRRLRDSTFGDCGTCKRGGPYPVRAHCRGLRGLAEYLLGPFKINIARMIVMRLMKA